MKLYIVNRFDRPYEKLIAELRKGRLYYIHPSIRNDDSYKSGFVLDDDATPLEDFGVETKTTGTILHGEVTSPSVASYHDGETRKWQGSSKFSFSYK